MILNTLPTIAGIVPWESKYSTPYYEVYTSNSPYSVNRRGPDVEYYTFSLYDANRGSFSGGTKIGESTTNLMKFYYGQAFPPYVQNYDGIAQFGMNISGHFFPPNSSGTFFIKGTGRACISLWTFNSGTIDLGMDRNTVATLRVSGLSDPIWGPNRSRSWLRISYFSPSKFSQSENVFVVTWKDATMDDEIPLTSYIYTNMVDTFTRHRAMDEIQVPQISEVSLDRDKNMASKLSFSVPIVETFDNTLGTFPETTALWHFRNNYLDSMGSHTLTRQSDLGFSNGYVEPIISSVRGSGQPEEYLYIPSADATDFDMGTDSFTIEVVCYPFDMSGDDLIRKGAADGGAGFKLYCNALGGYPGYIAALTDGTDVGYVFQACGTFGKVTPYLGLYAGWVYLAMVVDRTNDELRLYINGVEADSGAYDISAVGNISNASASLFIIENFNGVVDEIVVTKKVLTASEILQRVPSLPKKGFVYIPNGDYYQDSQGSEQRLKKFNRVLMNAGYKYSNGNIATVRKFTGQIHNWTVNRSKTDSKVENTLLVECQDWNMFLSSSINEGYPDLADYLMADYIDNKSVSPVAGDMKPRAYDGWLLYKALDNLLINAGLDPQLLNARYLLENVDGNYVESFYKVHDKNSNTPLRLNKSLKYGNPAAIDPSEADAEYFWQFSIGDKLADNIQRLADAYGLSYGFDNYGDFYVKSYKSPVKAKSIDDMSLSVGWAEVLDSSMLYGQSAYVNSGSDSIVATFLGRSCELIYNVDSSYGSFHIRVSNPTLGIVATVNVDTANSSDWMFFDGVDQNLGYNPCRVRLSGELNYGLYSLNIETVGDGPVSFNGLFVYSGNDDTPIETFYSGDTSTEYGVIRDSLQIESDADSFRNDIIVVGRLKGYRSTLSLNTDDKVTVNPNNPVADHVIGRAMDLVSIGSMTSPRFVGRKLQTIIIDPKIDGEKQAIWLATETLKRYNDPSKGIVTALNIVGNPIVETGDLVNIKDINLSVMGTVQNHWVSKISDTWSPDGEYKSVLFLEAYRPWESYFNYPTPSLKKYNNNPIVNLYTYNGGLPLEHGAKYCKVAHNQTDTPSTLHVAYYNALYSSVASLDAGRQRLERLVPSVGYIKLDKEVIKYYGRTINGPTFVQNGYELQERDGEIIYTNLQRGCFNTSQLPLSFDNYRNRYVENQLSPYTTEEDGVGPAVVFDLLYPGYVKVEVWSTNGFIVDVLTGNSAIGADEGWQYLDVGQYVFSWGMFDRVGQYNEANGGLFNYSGSPTLDIPDNTVDVLLNAEETDNPAKIWKTYYGSDMYKEEQYRIGSNFYVQNITRTKYGKFYFKVLFRDPTGLLTNNTIEKTASDLVHTIIRPDGVNVGDTYRTYENAKISWDSNGVSSFDSTFSSLWWMGPGRGYIPNQLGSILGANPEARKYYYRGDENGGKGPAVSLYLDSEFGDTRRVINLSVTRYIATFVRSYMKYYQRTGSAPGWRTAKWIELVDNLIEDPIIQNDSTTSLMSSTRPLVLYLSPPSVAYVTSAVSSKIYTLQHYESGNGVYTDFTNLGLDIAHLHLFYVQVQDQSGRKHAVTFSRWYVPQLYDTTEGNVTNTYDGVTPNYKVLFSSTSNDVGLFIAPPLGRTYYPIFETPRDPDKSFQIQHNGVIRGVHIYGQYF